MLLFKILTILKIIYMYMHLLSIGKKKKQPKTQLDIAIRITYERKREAISNWKYIPNDGFCIR